MRPGSTRGTPTRGRLAVHVRRLLQALWLRLLDLLVTPRCRRLVDSLDLPPHATVAHLRALIEERQEREIVVHFVHRELVKAHAGQATAKAAWLPGVYGRFDVLLVDSAAWHAGRDHNLRHEFGHMLLGHACRGHEQLWLGEQLEMLDPTAAKNFLAAKPPPALARGEWTSPRERETELVATLLSRRLELMHVSSARPEESLADARARQMLGLPEANARRRGSAWTGPALRTPERQAELATS